MHKLIPRGATTAEKLRGIKVWVPTSGRLRPAPGQRPGWVLDAGGGRPLPLWGSGGITSENFWKLRMLNLAFWWLLAVKWNFLFFENYGQEVVGPIHWWSPNLKVGGPVSSGPYGCFAPMLIPCFYYAAAAAWHPSLVDDASNRATTDRVISGFEQPSRAKCRRTTGNLGY